MSRCVVFENPGEIDPRLITTFGANVKEGSSPIGFFGTGLKFAIAVLLRKGQKVTIYSGIQVYEFGVLPWAARGKDFSLVAMNSEAQGFTTDVGKNWEVWMAYRELYSNCKDEGGRSYELPTSFCAPAAGTTYVVCEGEEIMGATGHHADYFIESPPLLVGQDCEVHSGSSKHLFYRGVRVLDLPQPGPSSLYTYNILGSMKLTEDRTLSDLYEAKRRISQAIRGSSDREFITRCLLAGEGSLERVIDFDWFDKPGDTFLGVVEQLMTDRIVLVNPTAVANYKRHVTAAWVPKAAALNRVENATLERAKAFCCRRGFDVTASNIVVVESLGPGILGMATAGTIYLTREVFSKGTKMVAGTIIEEFVHLKYGYLDCTRELQNFLLDRLVSLGEEVDGEPI